MGDLGLAERIVTAVRRAVALPVTVKFRLGLDDRRRNYLELGRVCEACGVTAVALHGRTARQMFGGAADWEPIARLKEALSIPVVGNGDVATAEDALAMLSRTGCDGVMIGRAATRNPWIFQEIAAGLRGGRAPVPGLAERCALVLDHFRTVAEREPARLALHKLRLFTRWYSYGLPQGDRLRRQISELGDVPGFLAAAERFCGALLVRDAA
jgi:nifR3 family TIM-barrel protein